MNALRFGAPSHPKTRHLVNGVVAGIGGYGNCMGVPTVGGETNFHKAYNGNILVNAMTVGLADTDKIFYSAAAGIGFPVVYVGSKTGRDGIHGATMASTEFTEESEEKRPTVQVGDPFTEKLLLEACLELMREDAIVAIQDMGAAGLTSSSVEMCSKGGLGMVMDLDAVPQREENMDPYEIMLSESQERMLMILKPGSEERARAIFHKWELDFAVIGTLNDSGRLVITMHGGKVYADMEVAPLVDKAPEYKRPWEPTPAQAEIDAASVPLPGSVIDALKVLVACPDVASKRWIWEQYDSQVMGDTIARSGEADAALVRVHGTKKALAITTDVSPRYCQNDPVRGGMQAVVEAWRNISAAGGLPLAITDNMNFGNPEKPRIMGQFVGACQGMSEACIALDFPVVSGNVSLYNETEGTGILPTPAIGGVGILADASRHARIALDRDGLVLIAIGGKGGHVGASLYLRELHGREDGAPPAIDLKAERRNGELVRKAIEDGLVTVCHDVADGGLLVTVAEMCMAGKRGASLTLSDLSAGALFGEDQSRYVIAVTAETAETILRRCGEAGVPATRIGTTGGAELTLAGAGAISVNELATLNEGWLPDYMSGKAA
jgi:phosphoribosylformylglycinamidine synthase